MSLAYSGFITPAAAISLVLGANLGSAINPLIEARQSDNPANRRLPLGNFLNRVVGCVLVLPFVHTIAADLSHIEPSAPRMAADFHTLFNVTLALLFIVPLGSIAKLLKRLLPDQPAPTDPGTPIYLDETALHTPAVALACAARETLRIADVIETMLRRSATALLTDDRRLVAEISRMDNAVDRLDEAVKLYLTKLTRESLGEVDGARGMEIISFSINLEHIGDIIDHNLMDLAAKKIRRRIVFSKQGAAELVAFHQEVYRNLKLAISVFMTGDVQMAQQLLAEKTTLRARELAAAESHLASLRDGRPESIESSALHLDVLRELKRIHSHLCSVAYPVLERAGLQPPVRLQESEPLAAPGGTSETVAEVLPPKPGA
jgi:phosphate:Na+ symporter